MSFGFFVGAGVGVGGFACAVAGVAGDGLAPEGLRAAGAAAAEAGAAAAMLAVAGGEVGVSLAMADVVPDGATGGGAGGGATATAGTEAAVADDDERTASAPPPTATSRATAPMPTASPLFEGALVTAGALGEPTPPVVDDRSGVAMDLAAREIAGGAPSAATVAESPVSDAGSAGDEGKLTRGPEGNAAPAVHESPRATTASASASSRADAKRSAGSRAQALANHASKPGGRPGASRDGGLGGGPLLTTTASAPNVSASKGQDPVTHS